MCPAEEWYLLQSKHKWTSTLCDHLFTFAVTLLTETHFLFFSIRFIRYVYLKVLNLSSLLELLRFDRFSWTVSLASSILHLPQLAASPRLSDGLGSNPLAALPAIVYFHYWRHKAYQSVLLLIQVQAGNSRPKIYLLLGFQNCWNVLSFLFTLRLDSFGNYKTFSVLTWTPLRVDRIIIRLFLLFIDYQRVVVSFLTI